MHGETGDGGTTGESRERAAGEGLVWVKRETRTSDVAGHRVDDGTS